MKHILALLLLPALVLSAAAEVKIAQAPDHSITATTPVYTVAFDPAGNLTALSVKGAKVLSHKFCGLEKTPPADVSVRVIGPMVAVRAGAARVEWTFGDDTIHVLTEGCNFECQLDASVKAVLAPVGDGYGALLTDGNQGRGLVHFAAGLPIVFTAAQQNMGQAPFALEYRLAVRGCLVVPAKPGPGPAHFGSLLERVLNEMMAKVDGASRSGPLAVMAGALRPDAVCAVDAFVHTSAGLSWTDKPYSGWGMPSGHSPADAAKVAQLAPLAAYLDPVNHAPDLKCPVIFGYGADDTLAPAGTSTAMATSSCRRS